MTGTWAAWRLAIFGDPYLVWHEGPSFSRLAAADPAEVARMLPLGLAEEDPVAAMSYASLPVAPADAVDRLRTALATSEGTFTIRCAQALHTLTGDPSWASYLLPVLGSASHWGTRLDAAIALATFPRSPELVTALLSAVEDPHYLVRYHAANSLLHYAGRRSTVDSSRRLFPLISSDDPADWHEAAALLGNPLVDVAED